MKTINETFTDEEHSELKKVKGKKTWHSFILKLLDYIEDEKEELKNNGTGQSIGSGSDGISST